MRKRSKGKVIVVVEVEEVRILVGEDVVLERDIAIEMMRVKVMNPNLNIVEGGKFFHNSHLSISHSSRIHTILR